jgi:hypothetical protein
MTLIYNMIDKMFKCYELSVRIATTPTTDQLVAVTMDALKVFKELYPEVGQNDKIDV